MTNTSLPQAAQNLMAAMEWEDGCGVVHTSGLTEWNAINRWARKHSDLFAAGNYGNEQRTSRVKFSDPRGGSSNRGSWSILTDEGRFIITAGRTQVSATYTERRWLLPEAYAGAA